MAVRAVLFDYSGTLFRLEEDDSWFKGMQVDEREVDGHVQAELMRRLTAPTGVFAEMTTGSDVAAAAGAPRDPDRPPMRRPVHNALTPADADAVEILALGDPRAADPALTGGKAARAASDYSKQGGEIRSFSRSHPCPIVAEPSESRRRGRTWRRRERRGLHAAEFVGTKFNRAGPSCSSTASQGDEY